MLRKPTLVNHAFANKISGTLLIISAVLSFVFYGYCISRLPLGDYPYAGIIVGEGAFLALDYLEFGIKLLIKIFLISAVACAMERYEHYADDRQPAYIWIVSLSLELCLYVRNISVALINFFSQKEAGLSKNNLDFFMEIFSNVMSIVAFSLLIAIAVYSADLLKAKLVLKMTVVTLVLSILFFGNALINLITLDHTTVSLFANLILFADGLTVFIPSVMIMADAKKESQVHYTSTDIYIRHHKER